MDELDRAAGGARLTDDDRRLLDEAAAYLENPSFLIKAANLVGKPAEALLNSLPERARHLIADSTADALQRGLDWAVSTIPQALPERSERNRSAVLKFAQRHGHTALTVLTGAGGGMLGLPGLTVELPATTMLMLRSIASIAAEHAIDLKDPRARLECLAVFSLGSRPLEEMDSAYFTTRLSLAMAVRQASHFVATHTAKEISEAVAKGTAPMLMRLFGSIATRFQAVVTEKVAAQAVPLVGAGLGAVVNAAFTDHFNRVARFHFSILALERRYGAETVQTVYEEACQAQRARRHYRVVARPGAVAF